MNCGTDTIYKVIKTIIKAASKRAAFFYSTNLWPTPLIVLMYLSPIFSLSFLI